MVMNPKEYGRLQKEFKRISSLLTLHKEEYQKHIIGRIKNGETQSEIARDLNVTRQAINNIIHACRDDENLPIDKNKQRFYHNK